MPAAAIPPLGAAALFVIFLTAAVFIIARVRQGPSWGFMLTGVICFIASLAIGCRLMTRPPYTKSEDFGDLLLIFALAGSLVIGIVTFFPAFYMWSLRVSRMVARLRELEMIEASLAERAREEERSNG